MRQEIIRLHVVNLPFLGDHKAGFVPPFQLPLQLWVCLIVCILVFSTNNSVATCLQFKAAS